MAASNSHLKTTYCHAVDFFLGAFQDGDTSMYPGDTVVARSIVLGEPVVFVSANYRLNGTVPFYMVMMDHPN